MEKAAFLVQKLQLLLGCGSAGGSDGGSGAGNGGSSSSVHKDSSAVEICVYVEPSEMPEYAAIPELKPLLRKGRKGSGGQVAQMMADFAPGSDAPEETVHLVIIDDNVLNLKCLPINFRLPAFRFQN